MAPERSKTGCFTCRARKKRCDEAFDSATGSCTNCTKRGIRCERSVSIRPRTSNPKKAVPRAAEAATPPVASTSAITLDQPSAPAPPPPASTTPHSVPTPIPFYAPPARASHPPAPAPLPASLPLPSSPNPAPNPWNSMMGFLGADPVVVPSSAGETSTGEIVPWLNWDTFGQEVEDGIEMGAGGGDGAGNTSTPIESLNLGFGGEVPSELPSDLAALYVAMNEEFLDTLPKPAREIIARRWYDLASSTELGRAASIAMCMLQSLRLPENANKEAQDRLLAESNSEVRYEPKELMEKGIRMNQPFIFVSLNYRLGALGFTASPPEPAGGNTAPHIPTRPPEELDLNVGFKDQIEALRWVRKEIEFWGGDKDKVTLLGHSAGAISVGLHQLYSPSELFRGAFMLSGAPTSFPVPWPHDAAFRTLHPLPEPTQCPWPVQREVGPPINTDLVNCLRELDLDTFMWAHKFMLDKAPVNGYFPWYPVLEGDFEGSWMDVRPSDRIVRGTYSKVPVVLGSVRDEGTRFTSPEIKNEQDIMDAIRGAFDFTYGAIEAILTPIWAHYPDIPAVGSPYQTGNATFGLSPAYKRAASILGDIFFQAPRRHFLRETPKDFGEPSWNFLYDEAKYGAERRLGAQHGADIGAWFGHPESDDPELHHLSRHMTAYLINFVANLDPNGPGLRPWPHYGMERKTLHLGRRNITITHDNSRLEPMRFINTQNPIFAR